MNKTELENIISYNNHAVTMAQIAVNLLEGKNPLNVCGVRELLALYLLVPYITNKRLDVPAANYNVPQLDMKTVLTKVRFKNGSLSEMTLDNLRNALCHSFVALTEKGDLILDDRASCDRKTHDTIPDKGFCNRLEVLKTRRKLLELHKKVLKQQAEFNNKLVQECEECK
ncbi:hypothetical protein [Candidatus Avelusimicrobium fimicolum]|uniref:hypothetical protein n=1 Tax=Candidatus Avelusimicrobium fimicolum TaxID=3416216 RepID=UPI003D0B7ABD